MASPPLGGGEGQKTLCTENWSVILGLFSIFHFAPEEEFSDVGGGGGGSAAAGQGPNGPHAMACPSGLSAQKSAGVQCSLCPLLYPPPLLRKHCLV